MASDGCITSRISRRRIAPRTMRPRSVGRSRKHATRRCDQPIAVVLGQADVCSCGRFEDAVGSAGPDDGDDTGGMREEEGERDRRPCRAVGFGQLVEHRLDVRDSGVRRRFGDEAPTRRGLQASGVRPSPIAWSRTPSSRGSRWATLSSGCTVASGTSRWASRARTCAAEWLDTPTNRTFPELTRSVSTNATSAG